MYGIPPNCDQHLEDVVFGRQAGVEVLYSPATLTHGGRPAITTNSVESSRMSPTFMASMRFMNVTCARTAVRLGA